MPFRFSSVAIGVLSLCAAAAQADALLRFDASKGACVAAERSQVPVIECDASAEPTVELGATPFVIERSGSHITFRFPTVAGQPLSITSENGGWHLSWKEASQSVSASKSQPAASTSSGPQIDVPGAPPAESGMVTSTTDLVRDAAIQRLIKPYEETQAKDLVFDFSVPESPGFVVVGMTPENVTHPRTLRDFVVSLKNGIDQSGNLKTGLALDFTPLQLLSNQNESIADYLDIDAIQKEMKANQARAERSHLFDSSDHILRNTTLSLATTQGTGDPDKSVNLGLGLHIPLIDKSDGRERAEDCFRGFFAAPIKDGGPTPELKDAQAANAATEKCFKETRWNDTVWTTSLGYAFSSDTGSFSELSPGARGIWTSFGYGFERGPPILRDHAQLILHAKYLYKERVKDPSDDKLFIDQDSRVLALAFKVGSPTFNASLQASFMRLKDRTHDKRDDVQRLSVGLEKRVAKDVWLVATIGGEGGRTGGENKSFVLGGLKFGSETSPRFSPR